MVRKLFLIAALGMVALAGVAQAAAHDDVHIFTGESGRTPRSTFGIAGARYAD